MHREYEIRVLFEAGKSPTGNRGVNEALFQRHENTRIFLCPSIPLQPFFLLPSRSVVDVRTADIVKLYTQSLRTTFYRPRSYIKTRAGIRVFPFLVCLRRRPSTHT